MFSFNISFDIFVMYIYISFNVMKLVFINLLTIARWLYVNNKMKERCLAHFYLVHRSKTLCQNITGWLYHELELWKIHQIPGQYNSLKMLIALVERNNNFFQIIFQEWISLIQRTKQTAISSSYKSWCCGLWLETGTVMFSKNSTTLLFLPRRFESTLEASRF